MSTAGTLALFYTALWVSLPIFAWVLLGLLLRLAGVLPPRLSDRLSMLAFTLWSLAETPVPNRRPSEPPETIPRLSL